ncbi:hypothetical protein [Mucilaginibacter pedocola]|uniref:Uncharacterized protein n=1 Tax=Mucilaginibacter pedocola TaxID=1792845 RepID=A0A1S9P855_9SPHI|nr:hypothetical protein [Mucilaginibacter pedocola]OOQ57141.1 hypothetical protein BC343_16610 [Mucilaginibacter pedocola]
MTLNQIIQRIKTIALRQGQVKSFFYGSVTDFALSHDTAYAACFLQDNGGNIDPDGKTLSFNFKLFLLDLVHVADEAKLNELDVQSDMVTAAQDIIAEIAHSSYSDWKPSSANNITLVTEELDDMLAGVVVDITVTTPYVKDVCAVPGLAQPVYALVEWDYFNTDPYATIATEEFRFSRQLPIGLPSYSLDFSKNANYKYIALKEPETEPEKLGWANTQYNYGTIPDQVFKQPISLAGYRYYVSRTPVVIDSTHTIISFNV